MRIAEVIGTVTLNQAHPLMAQARYRLAVPLSLANLRGDMTQRAEAIVILDDLGAGVGSLVAISEGGEAAQPFYPNMKPVDAYTAAILDHVQVEP